nr:hypothetical protein [Moorella mulderi]
MRDKASLGGNFHAQSTGHRRGGIYWQSCSEGLGGEGLPGANLPW